MSRKSLEESLVNRQPGSWSLITAKIRTGKNCGRLFYSATVGRKDSDSDSAADLPAGIELMIHLRVTIGWRAPELQLSIQLFDASNVGGCWWMSGDVFRCQWMSVLFSMDATSWFHQGPAPWAGSRSSTQVMVQLVPDWSEIRFAKGIPRLKTS